MASTKRNRLMAAAVVIGAGLAITGCGKEPEPEAPATTAAKPGDTGVPAASGSVPAIQAKANELPPPPGWKPPAEPGK
ncbi:MAG: hypothetical protein HZB16_23860 [Armatimonadetes bacterium]|nr:hypothetical protein [Armatimonadota bacterium]